MITVQDKTIKEWFEELVKKMNLKAIESRHPQVTRSRTSPDEAVYDSTSRKLTLAYVPKTEFDDELVSLTLTKGDKILVEERYTVEETVGWMGFLNRSGLIPMDTSNPGNFNTSEDFADDLFLRLL